jgi:hypothetical protein
VGWVRFPSVFAFSAVNRLPLRPQFRTLAPPEHEQRTCAAEVVQVVAAKLPIEAQVEAVSRNRSTRGAVVCTDLSREMYPGAETVTRAGRLVAVCVKEPHDGRGDVSVILIACGVGGGTGGLR